MVAAVTIVGGVALAVQNGESACEYEAAVEPDSYPSFEEQQREQVRTLADCMTEKDQCAPQSRLRDGCSSSAGTKTNGTCRAVAASRPLCGKALPTMLLP